MWNYSNDRGIIDVPQISPDQPPERPIWKYNCVGVDGHDDSHATNERYASFMSPMYEGLETNIPKCLMRHSDTCFSKDNQLFPSREAVIDYLEAYGEAVRPLVHFQTQVTDVKQKSEERQSGWIVETRDLINPAKPSKRIMMP